MEALSYVDHIFTMDKQTIGIAALLSGVLGAIFLSPPDLATQLTCAFIAAGTTLCAGLAIRKLESPDNPLPQALYSRVAACATLGLVVAVVLINLLGVAKTSLE
jgi:hypothetical protein